jgi:hypothetical protein
MHLEFEALGIRIPYYCTKAQYLRDLWRGSNPTIKTWNLEFGLLSVMRFGLSICVLWLYIGFTIERSLSVTSDSESP